jgi:hypothetical protein
MNMPTGNDCYAVLSPEASSPGSVRHYDRRSSLLSIPEVVQPLTPPSSDSSDHTLLGDVKMMENISSGEMEIGELQGELDFSILFPDVDDEKRKSEDACSPMEQGHGSTPIKTDPYSMFADHVHHFPEFHGLDHILEQHSPEDSIGNLFHDVVMDGRYSGLSPAEEFIIPQAPSTRLRNRRKTDASEASNQSFSTSLSHKHISGFIIDESTREWILSDLSASHPRDLLTGFCLPNSTTLQRYLDSYFNCFHKNFPILHLPTFHLKGTKALLLLAVCCIGAQYCLEKRRARYLFEWTKRFIAVEDVKWKRVEVERKAWLVRSKLLLGFFGIWSAEREVIQDTISEQGWYSNVSPKIIREPGWLLTALDFPFRTSSTTPP